MTKTIRELVEFLGNENMKFALKSKDGISPKEYYSKKQFFKVYNDWIDEVPCDWLPKNFEIDGIWNCLFII